MTSNELKGRMALSIVLFILTGILGGLWHDTFLMFMCGFWGLSIMLYSISLNMLKEDLKK